MSDSKAAYLCIDGVEDCSHEQQQAMWTALRKLLRHDFVKLMVAARDETEILNALPGPPQQIRVDQGSNSDDIEFYIEENLKRLSRPGQIFADAGLREKAKKKLTEQSNGMFLWVHLLLESLAECDTQTEMQSTMQTLPQTLEQTYLLCLRRKRGGKLMCRPKVLKWAAAAAAAEPLSVDCIREMLAISRRTGECRMEDVPHTQAIVRSAVSLLSLDADGKLFTPIHLSARKFILSQNLREQVSKTSGDSLTAYDKDFDISLQEATLQIAEISLSHLKARTLLPVERIQRIPAPLVQGMVPPRMARLLGLGKAATRSLRMVDPRPAQGSTTSDFLGYALRTWTMHSKNLQNRHSCWEDFVQLSLTPNVPWKLHPWPSPRTSTNTTAHLRGLLGFAVSQDHVPLLRVLLQNSNALPREVYDHVLPGNELLPPLHVAAGAGYVEVTALLVRVCSLNRRCPLKGRTALHYAAALGNSATVYVLSLAPGIDFNVRDNENNSPLCLAVAGSDAETIRSLLYSAKIDLLKVDKFGQSELSSIALNANEAMMKAILESGKVNPNTKDEQGRTMLLYAAEMGSAAVTRLLLNSSKIDANLEDPESRTPLMLAAICGKETIVELLINSYKVNANLRDKQGRTPLLYAVEMGKVTMVKLLLNSSKVDANLRDNEGRTPLWWAARKMRENVVRVLLACDKVDANLGDMEGQTPLSSALELKHEAIVRLMVDSCKVHINSPSWGRAGEQ